jgi:hypothetical protein
MDGGHRIAKAWLLGLEEIVAVRFETDPAPDSVTPLPRPGEGALDSPHTSSRTKLEQMA